MELVGPVGGEGLGPAVEGEGLDKTRNAEEVVGVPVGDEDGVDEKTGPRPHHLLLRPFAAVEEQGVRAPPDHDAGGVPVRRGQGPGRSEEVHLQGLSGYTNHLLKTSRLFFASSMLRPSLTSASTSYPSPLWHGRLCRDDAAVSRDAVASSHLLSVRGYE